MLFIVNDSINDQLKKLVIKNAKIVKNIAYIAYSISLKITTPKLVYFSSSTLNTLP